MTNKIKLTANFSLHEFACKCGCNTVMLHPDLLNKLQLLRNKVGKSLTINSGYRCPQHNKNVGGVKDSLHMKGQAVDIKLVNGLSVDTFAKLAEEIGFKGIGKYNTFLHVDIRPKITRWDYRK